MTETVAQGLKARLVVDDAGVVIEHEGMNAFRAAYANIARIWIAHAGPDRNGFLRIGLVGQPWQERYTSLDVAGDPQTIFFAYTEEPDFLRVYRRILENGTPLAAQRVMATAPRPPFLAALDDLAARRRAGELTEEEFQTAKADLLAKKTAGEFGHGSATPAQAAPVCPACGIPISYGQTLCGNCRMAIDWSTGQPSASVLQATGQFLGALGSLIIWGCLVVALVALIIYLL